MNMSKYFVLSLFCYATTAFDYRDLLQNLLTLHSQDGLLSMHGMDSIFFNLTGRITSKDAQSVNCSDFKCSCLNGRAVLSMHGLAANESLSVSEFKTILPGLIVAALSENCGATHKSNISVVADKKRGSWQEVWGYGILCVSIINLCSLMGLIFKPFMNTKFYHKLLMFMVALAVGTLCGSSLLFLLPEAFHLTQSGSISYVWVSTVVVSGIYLFFVVERVLKLVMEYRQRRHGNQSPRSRLPICSPPFKAETRTRHESESMNMNFDPPHDVLVEEPEDTESEVFKPNGSAQLQSNVDNSVSLPPTKQIKGVAWMVIFGDGLHNFIDGLSIGAAFTHSTVAGVSISLAVVCEELPHELGDFAILLNAGMTLKQALGFNFLSACMCYLGLAVGISVGEIGHASTWIFAIAGGMFLYISLVDMLPEVNHAAETEPNQTKTQIIVFLIQNFGLLVGYAIMLILAVYSQSIEINL